MAITDGLCTLDEVKAALALTVDNTVHDTRIEVAVEAASRMIESECRRTFTDAGSATARLYVAEHPWYVEVDDFHTTTGLVVRTDPGADGTFDLTWSTGDYQLEPLSGRWNGRTWPYNRIRARASLTFPRYRREALIEVTAQWGWASVPTDVKQAAIVQSVALFKASDAPFGAAGVVDAGVLRIRTALHPTAAALVAEYRRDSALVA